VRRRYYEGLPLDQARKYRSQEDISTLLKMLRSNDYAEYWPNILAVLGVVGNDSTIDSLSAFLKLSSTSRPHATYRAKLQVQVSLGYLLHEKGSSRALELLKRGTDPERWKELEISLPETTINKSALALAESSILGLGASGNKEALIYLQSMSHNAKILATTPELRRPLQQAMEINQRVSTQGLH
jgi:hypothetical protein